MQSEYHDLENKWAMPQNSRLGFIRKVYGILSAQLAFTTLVCLIVAIFDKIQVFLITNFWILWVGLIIQLFVICTLFCCKRQARSVPTNYILLGVFTFIEAVIVAVICSAYPWQIVLTAVIMTLGVTVALTLYACFTKTDFTYCGAFLSLFLGVFVFFGLGMLILGSSQMTTVIYCSLGIFIYGIYLVIDTQLIIGTGKYKLTEDDYIVGALILYIDIIQLFLFILRLLGSSKNS